MKENFKIILAKWIAACHDLGGEPYSRGIGDSICLKPNVNDNRLTTGLFEAHGGLISPVY